MEQKKELSRVASAILPRLGSAILIAIIVLVSIFIYRISFYLLLLIVAAIELFECYNLAKKLTCNILLFGYIIIPLQILSLSVLSIIDSTGFILLYFFLVIFSVDTMAMIGGKLLQGPKLAPNLSPQKTFSGLFVGITSAVLLINILLLIFDESLDGLLFSLSQKEITILTILLGLLAQAGDLFESYIKRIYKVKDSGNVIPGHGGMLDRLDSTIFTAPLLLTYCWYIEIFTIDYTHLLTLVNTNLQSITNI